MGNRKYFSFKVQPFEFLRDMSFFLWVSTEYTISHSVIAQLSLGLFCVINILSIIRHRISTRTLFSRTVLLFWIFIVIAYLNIVFGYSINPDNSFFLMKALLKNGVFLVFAFHYITSIGIERFKKVFVFSTTFTSLLLLIITFAKYHTFVLRGESGLVNANILALADTLAICWILSDVKNSGLNKTNYIVIMLLLAFCFSSGSKKFLIGFVVWLTAYFVLKNPAKLLGNLIRIAIIFAAGYIVIMKIPVIYNSFGIRIVNLYRVINGGVGDRSSEVRYNLMKIGYQMFLEKPLFGHGINCFYTVNPYRLYSHSNYIELLYSLGIIGIISYYSIHASFLISGLKKINRSKNMNVLLGVSFVFFLLATDIGLVSYFDRTSLIMLIICNALIISDYHYEGSYKNMSTSKRKKMEVFSNGKFQ